MAPRLRPPLFPVALGATRIRILYGILHKLSRPHRYTVARWGVGITFTLAIAALVVFDVLRFDLWRGEHRVLGEHATLVEAARAFAFPFLFANILIVVASRFIGRYLCGFVCPVGSLARCIEWARFTGRRRRMRFLGPLVALLASTVLGAITFAFWVDPRVFLAGSSGARVAAGALLTALILGLFALVQLLGLRFCRDWCPSGVYFAVLGQETTSGVELAHPEACTACGLCDQVCPMELEPRAMSGGAYRGARGLYADHLSNFALCIRCGDCVAACEEVGSRASPMSALRMGFLPPDARESRPLLEPLASERAAARDDVAESA